MTNENKNEIIETENDVVELKDADLLNADYNFEDKIEVAVRVAKSLRKIIDSQNLAVNIAGKEYLTVESWNALGTLLGCSVIIEKVEEVPMEGKHKFGYVATASIRQGNKVISRASAFCERNNSQRERYAVYSMAETRSISKAYRIALSWIIKLASYEVTPAEEVPAYFKKQRRSD